MNPLMRYRINSPTVVHETFDDEVVLINFDTGSYYSLDGVGTHIWGLIRSGTSLGNIVESTAQQYEGSRALIEDAVDQFIVELQEEELIAPHKAKEPTSSEGLEGPFEPRSGNEGRRFAAPVMSRYTDMQDLLLLDPIHEVDDPGWPSVKPDSSDEEG